MKTTLTILTLSLIVGATSVASAGDDPAKGADAKKATATAAPAKMEKQKVTAKTDSKEVLTTGSHMKQRVRRNGMITDGSSQVLVLDRGNIDHSGANTVTQLLNRYGAR